MRRFLSAAIGLAAIAVPAAAQEAPPAPVPVALNALTAEARARIDAAADTASLPVLQQESVDFSGDLVAWAISQTVLPLDEEVSAAAEAHAAILAKTEAAETDPAVRAMFERLQRALPKHLNPDGLTWTLTTLRRPEVNAFTIGGGYLYLHEPLVRGLWSDAERGPAALAFILAHEMGHVVRGHCRRGYQGERIEAEIKAGLDLKIENETLRKILKTAVNPGTELTKFLYGREQELEADLFALHLCRNAGIDLDHALDGLRWLVALQFGRFLSDSSYAPAEDAEGETAVLRYLVRSHPKTLQRLRRLRMETSGATRHPDRFGLFTWDAESAAHAAAGDGAVNGEARVLVLVHGMAGNEQTFAVFRERLANEALPHRILELRWPNDGSVAHAAALLRRELRRVAPKSRPEFVVHSAGGLVVRAYAERLGGPCRSVCFLGTPHLGSDLAEAKGVIDLAQFLGVAGLGVPEAVSQSLGEGSGQIGHDLLPGSLFLAWLGPAPNTAAHYHSHAGRLMNGLVGRGVRFAFNRAKPRLAARIGARIETDWLREAVLARVNGMELTAEILNGDLVVSTTSGIAAGPGPKVWSGANHLTIKTQEPVLAAVLAVLRR